jgi:hypothetical protein
MIADVLFLLALLLGPAALVLLGLKPRYAPPPGVVTAAVTARRW